MFLNVFLSETLAVEHVPQQSVVCAVVYSPMKLKLNWQAVSYIAWREGGGLDDRPTSTVYEGRLDLRYFQS
jgi:hypothetical protein